jgi:flagellar motor switch protein FliG
MKASAFALTIQELSLSQKAAIVMLALKTPYHIPIWDLLSTEDVIRITQDMAQLGLISSSIVDEVLENFLTLADPKSLYGDKNKIDIFRNAKQTEAPQNLWKTLVGLQDQDVLVHYLSQEDPLIGGYILTQVHADTAFALFDKILPENFAACLLHWLSPPSLTIEVQKDIEQHFIQFREKYLQQKLRTQTISQYISLATSEQKQKLLSAIHEMSPTHAMLIINQMISFESLFEESEEKRHMLIQHVDKNLWALALIPFCEKNRMSILGLFSDRMRHMIQEDLKYHENSASAYEIKSAQKSILGGVYILMNSGKWILENHDKKPYLEMMVEEKASEKKEEKLLFVESSYEIPQ